MSWNIQDDNTSFSSFQSQRNQSHHRRTDTAYFSQFQEEYHQPKIHHDLPSFGNQFSSKQMHAQRQKQTQQAMRVHEQKIKALEEENILLKKQNQLLKKESQHYKGNFSKLKLKNEQLMLKVNIQQSDEQEDKQKYLSLVGEVKRLKDSLNEMKRQVEKKDKNSQNLVVQIRELRKKSEEEEWRENFVQLFLDMMMKISKEISPQWRQKKKLQVSWKMAKNIIKKALNSGIQLPKVIKNSVDMTYLSQFSKNA